MTPSCSKSNGKAAEKHLPSPPPPTPPAKESASASRLSLPSPSSLATSSKLKKERKDKGRKKFSIGADDDDAPPVPALFPVTHARYHTEPLPRPKDFVYDLSLDRDHPSNKDLPTTPRLRPPITRKQEGYEGSAEAGGSSSSSTQRRWTLALAMTSDDLTDEVFVEKVERIRRDSQAGVEGVGGFRGWEFGYLDPDDSDGSDDQEDGYDYEETFEGAYDMRETSISPSMPDLASRPMSVMNSYATSEVFPSRSASVMTMGELLSRLERAARLTDIQGSHAQRRLRPITILTQQRPGPLRYTLSSSLGICCERKETIWINSKSCYPALHAS